jgi:hypothetical protein
MAGAARAGGRRTGVDGLELGPPAGFRWPFTALTVRSSMAAISSRDSSSTSLRITTLRCAVGSSTGAAALAAASELRAQIRQQPAGNSTVLRGDRPRMSRAPRLAAATAAAPAPSHQRSPPAIKPNRKSQTEKAKQKSAAAPVAASRARGNGAKMVNAGSALFDRI